jgi:hypothetical protein
MEAITGGGIIQTEFREISGRTPNKDRDITPGEAFGA